jgi:hypothetical protein
MTKSRIVRTDNFDRSGEEPGCDEKFVLHAMEERYAAEIVKILNRTADPAGPDYYKVVGRDYKLVEFEP